MSEFDFKNFIQTQWAKIPVAMQKAISDSRWTEVLQTIARRHAILPEDAKKLEQEIMIFLLGGTHAGDLLTAIKDNLKLADDKAVNLMNDLNGEIFSKIATSAEAGGMPEPQEEKLTPEQQAELDALNKEEGIPTEEEYDMAQRLKSLPPDMQKILTSPELTKKIKELGDKLGLREEDLSSIENGVILACLYETGANEIQNNLEKKGIVKEKASVIAKTIDTEILGPWKMKNKAMPANQELDKRFSGMQKEIQTAISQSDYPNQLEQIRKIQSLNIEQMGILEDIMTDTIVGTIPVDKFENTIIQKLGLSKEKAKEIATQVNEKILKTIREKLMDIYGRSTANNKDEGIMADPDGILKQAGIEILAPELESGKDEKKDIAPLHVTKLSTAYKIPQAKTQYAVGNMTKKEDKIASDSALPLHEKPITPITPLPGKGDPYRMPIE